MTNEVPTRSKYTERYTLIVTEEMDRKLQQLLDKQDRSVSLSDLLRTAIREYIDDQEDVIGSRRHFSKSLQNRLDQLENNLLFYLDVIIFLLAANLAVIVMAVTRDPKVQSTNLIRVALKTALTEGPVLNQQIAAVRKELSGE